MAITFYIDLMVGEFMDKDSSGQLKLMIFYSVMFLQGFVNNLLQTTMARYVFNFSENDIANFASGTAVAGVGSGGLAFLLTFTGLDISNQFIIYLAIITM